MKATSWITAAVALAALIVAGALSSCATHYSKTTYPDGRIVEEKISGIDPAAGAITGTVAGAVVDSRSSK